MTDRRLIPPAEFERLVTEAGGVDAFAERHGVAPEFVREVLVGQREVPEWWTDLLRKPMGG